MTGRLRLTLITLFIFIFTFGINVILLPGYGMNWDEPAHYLRGQAYLWFFLTGKKDYAGLPKLRSHYPNNFYSELPPNIDFEDDRSFRRSIYQYDREGSKSTFPFFLQTDYGHPPVSDILASLFNFIFYQKLGVLGDIESYHLFIVLVSSMLVAGVFLFGASHYGIFAGLVSALALFLFPLFFSESHFNIKDPVQTSFFAFSIMTFYRGITTKSFRWVIASAFFSALALGTKLNIVFSGLSIVLWLIILYWGKIRSFRWPFSFKLSLGLLAYPVIVMGVIYLFWPYLWDDPIGKAFKSLAYYREIGAVSYQPKEFILMGVVNTYAWQWLLFSTPIVILVLTFFGLVYLVKKARLEKQKTSLLLFFWFIIPFLRVTIPGTGIYGGLRQIMEFIPAMSMLAGIGAGFIARNLLFRILIILSFIPVTIRLISIHPNQNVYFNPLIGGLKGAQEMNFPDWGVTLGSVYQQGVNWLNANAEKEAKLTLVKGLLSNVPSIKLRKDIGFGERYYSGPAKNGEYIMEVFDYYWVRDVTAEKRQYLATLKPVHQVSVDSVPILIVWKNDLAHTIP